jgi:apolipoprotein N-acyltransferase
VRSQASLTMPVNRSTASAGTGALRKRSSVAVLVVSALCACLAFPPLHFWPAIFIAVALLIHAARTAKSTRGAMVMTFCVYFLLWLWVDAWILDVTTAGWPVTAAYMSIYTSLAVWCIRRIDGHSTLRHWPTAVTAPIIFVGLECIRGLVIFDGYAWYFIGQPIIDWVVLAQPADLLGIWWGSFVVAVVAGWGADALCAHRRRQQWHGCVIAACVLVFAIPYGLWRVNQIDVLRPGPSVLAIQTNLPQDNKIGWQAQAWASDVMSFIDLTQAGIESSGNVDLIVWPETMVPGLGFDVATRASLVEAGPGFSYLYASSDAVTQLGRDLDRPMIVGSSTWLSLSKGMVEGSIRIEPDTRFNSAVLLSPDGTSARYDKVVLTPFGERMPYLEHWPWLEDQLMAFGARGMQFNLDPAEAVNVLEVPFGEDIAVVGTPICFEDTVPGLVRQLVYAGGRKRADLLINLSNDGWFGAHDAVRAAHGQVARWRCIENRVPLIRAVNTGDTSWSDSCGRLVAMKSSGTATWLSCSPELDTRSTIFGMVIGNSLAWFMLLMLVCMLLTTWPRKSEESSTNEAVT